MPTTYAHYRFGRSVYRRLPEQIQAVISSHGGLYNIGLHGPDLLFYYRVFQKNPVSQTGFDMHARPGKEFFQEAAAVIRQRSGRIRSRFGKTESGLSSASFMTSARYAYIFGFLCHFALDSSCHPYVEQMVRATGITHSEIEAELDRDLMLRDGLDPMICRPTTHLKARLFYGSIISRFFHGVTARQIVASIRSMRLCCNMLAPSGRKLRSLLRLLMKGGRLPSVVRDMVIKARPNPACAPITRELERRYQEAASTAVRLMVNFVDHVEQGSPLDESLNHTFGED